MRRPPLTAEQVLGCAGAHRERTGVWPTLNGGPVEGAPGETWYNVNAALRDGLRGLPRGGSLSRLLARRRGAGRSPASPA